MAFLEAPPCNHCKIEQIDVSDNSEESPGQFGADFFSIRGWTKVARADSLKSNRQPTCGGILIACKKKKKCISEALLGTTDPTGSWETWNCVEIVHCPSIKSQHSPANLVLPTTTILKPTFFNFEQLREEMILGFYFVSHCFIFIIQGWDL